jgi:hypothetical protein
LQARRTEIEQAALARVYSLADPGEPVDPEYAEGLRVAVSAAIEYGVAALERGQDQSPPIPSPLLTQARLAARNGVTLDTVLRRYFAGYTLLGDFLAQEAEDDGLLGGAPLRLLMRTQAALFDRLVAVVTDEYTREADKRLDSSERRRAERVEGLLAGELLDTTELGYDFEAHHLGLIGTGPQAAEAIQGFSADIDCRTLVIRHGEGTVWAWLGARRPIDAAEFYRLALNGLSAQLSLAMGEPDKGLAGWRQTHRQAMAALPIAQRGSENVVRYGNIALLASMLQDELLTTSLRRLYLEPLALERDGGEVLRETLRAYFAAERNISSAAVALGVKRHTVTNRLRTIEDRLGRSLADCATELDAVLRLEDLGLDVFPRVGVSLG